jgi:Protein of unknown function (DUF2804)
VSLPAAPRSPVVAGRPAFGTYEGMCDDVTWGDLRDVPGPLWRLLHHKSWHYVSIAGPRIVFAMAIVNLGWVGSAFAYVFDRQDRQMRANLSWTGLPPLVADRAGDGAVSTITGGGAHLRLERPVGASAWRVHARWRSLAVDATLVGGAPSLCAIAEIQGGIAVCTHKTACLAASGSLSAGGVSYTLDAHTGLIDHTSGYLARDTRWKWVSASSPELALNLTEGYTNGVENAVWHGGALHKVAAAEILYDLASPRSPWRIRTTCGAVDLTFAPEGERAENKNLLVAASRYVQPFGTFRGRVLGDDVDGLCGVTEDHAARW